MQNADWIALFRQLPEEMHPAVMLILTNRTEISVETIFRIDPAFLIIRGRLGGTTEGGMPFIVPYVQLSSMYLYRQIQESEIQGLFGSPAAAPLAQRSAHGSANGSAERPAPPRPSAQGLPFGRPPEATAVARNNLLERLRAARQASQPQQPPSKS